MILTFCAVFVLFVGCTATPVTTLADERCTGVNAVHVQAADHVHLTITY